MTAGSVTLPTAAIVLPICCHDRSPPVAFRVRTIAAVEIIKLEPLDQSAVERGADA